MKENNYPKVSIIILNWNNYEDTKECLLSLDKITYPNYEVIVVDNGSIDGSTLKIQKEFPQHKYIYNNDNLGFTEGNNIGMEYAMKKGTDFVLVLNNDITVENGFLESLVDIALKNPDAGIVGPAVYFYHEPACGNLLSRGRVYRHNRKRCCFTQAAMG